MAKIIELRAENVRVLKCVRITPEENVVIIGGENGSGKTTVLDVIQEVMAGAKAAPRVPIRRGAATAKASLRIGEVADLGEITVELTYSGSGRKLVVRGKNGQKVDAPPQELLDRLYSRVAFDPGDFADRMEPRKRGEVLREVVGLDFSRLEQRRAQIEQTRLDEGRELKQLQGQLAGMPEPRPDTPVEELDVKFLWSEKARIDDVNGKAEIRAMRLRASRERHQVAEARANKLRADLAQAEKEVAAMRAEVAQRTEDVEALPRIDDGPIVEKLKSADQVNAAVRAKRERGRVAGRIAVLEEHRRQLTDDLREVDDDKARMLASARWPIEGLGFDQDGVTYQGLPFEQASKAERYRVAVALGAALNPELRVLLNRDGSLLDEASMRMLAELAQERDLQLWVERVGSKDPGAIVLEDGEIRQEPAAAES